ncbi:hybrid sensor histidine kinase/response regulator [Nibricoccus aquaticus]|uniref:histidine kinase n=1 Tax=Nibricoccus aquaticus TaxID=2576891 RepID=A0A290QH03_9BACT|nr:ATP-binding protein [Nibricoccus aquaticus]ATC65556.1 hybrid sensor histidine kinase/response regulator [Nibricoccus aquaticus]
MGDTTATNILIVDDEPRNLLALDAILEPLKQNVTHAHSGAEALRHVLNTQFAVILLDVQMPTMDGFEVASLIRARERSRVVPIVFLTGIGNTQEWVSRGYVAGAVDYMIKPIVPEILRSKVEIFVELAKSRSRIEEELRARVLFTQEIATLNQALQKSNDELLTMNEDLAAFNQTVSHDLRAPLRHIQGFIEILGASLSTQLTEPQQKQFAVIKNSAARMVTLINDLLAFCRLSRAQIQAQRVDMQRLVESVRASLEPDFQDRIIEWDISNLGTVYGDEALLRQVWSNLISNALKYSRKVTPARIVIDSKDERPEKIFRITDNGAGFDMKYAGKLFGVFERLHPEKEFEGVGIGLANVRRIVERHGGRVWAEGSPGNGATFYFALPNAPRDSLS